MYLQTLHILKFRSKFCLTLASQNEGPIYSSRALAIKKINFDDDWISNY